MTIKEIAKESGYGVGTVSRVLNNNPSVSETARKAIMEIVEKHNFQPNSNARQLKQQTASGIVLIVKGVQNMLFMPMVEKIQALVEKNGYACIIHYIDQDADELMAAEQICREHKPNGFMFLGSNIETYQADNFRLDVPCILLTTSSAELNIDNLSSIAVDDSAAASCLMDQLFECGHRKIGVIGGSPELSRPSYLRLLGYRNAMFRHGIIFDEETQYEYARFSMESGYEAANRLLTKFPDMTAVFAMSDMMAFGVLRALHEHGLRVPEDVSVVGFDGIPICDFMVPKLTTIRQNTDRIAERAVEILMHNIREGGFAVHEIVPYEIIRGESVKVIKQEEYMNV